MRKPKRFERADPAGLPKELQQADMLEDLGFVQMASRLRKQFTTRFLAEATAAELAKTTR